MAVLFDDADISQLAAISNTATAVTEANRQVDLITASPLMLQTVSYTRFAPVLSDGSVLIGGPDRRKAIALPPLPDYKRDVADHYKRLLGNMRDVSNIAIPIGFPDPSGEFYGYDRPAPPWTGVERWIKGLPSTAAYGAGALVSVLHDAYITGTAAAKRLYAQHFADGWVPFVSEADQYCRSIWQYQVPTAQEDRQRLRRLCETALAFENHCLQMLP